MNVAVKKKKQKKREKCNIFWQQHSNHDLFFQRIPIHFQIFSKKPFDLYYARKHFF